MLVDEGLQVTNQLLITALSEQRIKTSLNSLQPQLGEPPNLGESELLIGEVGVRIPTPESESRIE